MAGMETIFSRAFIFDALFFMTTLRGQGTLAPA
jgi:hypothetical protein